MRKDELRRQISAYSQYIMDANDENLYVTGWTPVCFDEFVMNEYEEEINERA